MYALCHMERLISWSIWFVHYHMLVKKKNESKKEDHPGMLKYSQRKSWSKIEKMRDNRWLESGTEDILTVCAPSHLEINVEWLDSWMRAVGYRNCKVNYCLEQIQYMKSSSFVLVKTRGFPDRFVNIAKYTLRKPCNIQYMPKRRQNVSSEHRCAFLN